MTEFVLSYLLIGIAFSLTNWILNGKEFNKILQEEYHKLGREPQTWEARISLVFVYCLLIFTWPISMFAMLDMKEKS